MPGYFLDTSAFAKLYHRETGSDYVERLVALPGSTSVVSRLALVEIEAVFAIKIRTGEMDAAGHEFCRRRLRADISQRRIRVGPPIEERHFLSARRLLVQHAPSIALRTLDAIQLSVALDLKQSGLVSVVVTADLKLCSVAEICGLSTINPTAPDLVLP